MFLAFLIGDLIGAFLATYSTYALKEIYHLEGNIAKTMGILGLITGPVRMVSLVVSGPLIESSGRRMPQILGGAFFSLGLLIIPLGL